MIFEGVETLSIVEVVEQRFGATYTSPTIMTLSQPGATNAHILGSIPATIETPA